MAYKKNNTRTTPAPAPEAAPAWTNVCGAMRVYGKPRTGKKGNYLTFSSSVGRKDEESGEYDNVYFDILFKRGEMPNIEGAFIIDIKAGFLTLRKFPTQYGSAVNPAVMVLDYEVIED